MLHLQGSATKRQRLDTSRSVADSTGSPVVSRVSVLQPLQVEYFDANGEPRKRNELDSECIHVDSSSIRIASPLPAAVSELLAADSNLTTQIDLESDTLWLVSNRRLLVWPNYAASLDLSSATESRSRPKCYTLHLPTSDTPYRAQLIHVASRASTLCCVAVSAGGLVRFWPNCAFEQQFTEFAIDLRGDELVALGRIPVVKSGAKTANWTKPASYQPVGTSLFVAATLCGNIVHLYVSGNSIHYRVVRDDPGVLRRVFGTFRTFLPAANGSQPSVAVSASDGLFRVLISSVRGSGRPSFIVTSVSRTHVSRWRVELESDVTASAQLNDIHESRVGAFSIGELLKLISGELKRSTGESVDAESIQIWDSNLATHDESVLYLLVSATMGGTASRRPVRFYVARIQFGEAPRVTVELRKIPVGDAPLHNDSDLSRLERLQFITHVDGGARLVALAATFRRTTDVSHNETQSCVALADRLVLARFVDGGGVFEVLPTGCVSVALASIRDRLVAVRVRSQTLESGRSRPNDSFTCAEDDHVSETDKERCVVRVELVSRRHALVDVAADLPVELDAEDVDDSHAAWQPQRTKDSASQDCFSQLRQLAAALRTERNVLDVDSDDDGDGGAVDFDAAKRCIVQAVAGAASRFDSLDAARLSERIAQLAVDLRAALANLPRELVRDALYTLLGEKTSLGLNALLGSERSAPSDRRNASMLSASKPQNRRSHIQATATPSHVGASFSIALAKDLRTRLRFVVALRNLLRKCSEDGANVSSDNREDAARKDLRECVQRCDRAERELIGLVRYVHFHTDRNLPLTASIGRFLAVADHDGVAKCDQLFSAAVLAHLDVLDSALRHYVRDRDRETQEVDDDEEPATSCEVALDCLVELLGDAAASTSSPPRRRAACSTANQLGVIRAFIDHETLRERLFETVQKVFFAARACKLKRADFELDSSRRRDPQLHGLANLSTSVIVTATNNSAKLEATFVFLVEHYLVALRLISADRSAETNVSNLPHFFVEARRVLLDQIDTILLGDPSSMERERVELALRLASQLDDAARCAVHTLAQTDATNSTHDAPTLVRELRAQFAARNASLADRFEHELMEQIESRLAGQQLTEAQTFALLGSLVRKPPASLERLSQRAANQRWLHLLGRDVAGSENEDEKAVNRHLEAFRSLAKLACDENLLLERKRRAVALGKLQLNIARRISSRQHDSQSEQLEEALTLTSNYELYLESMHDALVGMRDVGVLVCESEPDADATAASDRYLPVFTVFELVRGLSQLARVARDSTELQTNNEQRSNMASSSDVFAAYERASESAMLRLKSAVDTLRLFEKAYRFENRFGFDDGDESQAQKAAKQVEESRAAIDDSWSFIWEQAALAENWPRLAELATADSADDAAGTTPYRPERDVVRLQLHRRTVFYKLVEVLVIECPQADARQLLATVPTVDALAESSEPLRELVTHSDLARLVLHNALDCFLHD